MKFIDYFERTYVINLPYRVDRRQAMEKELQNAGMPFTPGKVELFKAIRPDSAGPFRSIGARGAFFTHLAVLKQAREQQLRNVLVMEDDLALSPHFNKYEDWLIEQMNQTNWDLVHFGYNGQEIVNLEEDSFPKFQPFSGEITGTQLYGVNAKALDRLINFYEVLLQRPAGHPDGGPMDADGVYNVFRWQNPDIVRLILVPSFGGQRASSSDVTPAWFDQVPLLNQVANLMRKLGIGKYPKKLLRTFRGSRSKGESL